VQQTGVVRHVERGRHLGEDRHRALRRQRPLLLEEVAQVGAGHVLHGDVVQAVRLAGLEHLHDVRMLERARIARLAQEALEQVLVALELLTHDLQDRLLLRPLPGGEVDRGHSTHADQALQPVAGDRGADADALGHGAFLPGFRPIGA
jgi:hypothetical protein